MRYMAGCGAASAAMPREAGPGALPCWGAACPPSPYSLLANARQAPGAAALLECIGGAGIHALSRMLPLLGWELEVADVAAMEALAAMGAAADEVHGIALLSRAGASVPGWHRLSGEGCHAESEASWAEKAAGVS